MQTLYGIHINNVNQVSVDVYSDKHAGTAKWRVYFGVRPSTINRLRRIYAKHPGAFYINKEWSPSRWKAYKRWALSWGAEERPLAREASLDSLETSEH